MDGREEAKGSKGALKRLLSNRTNSYLNPDEKHSQFQRSRSFIDGLKKAGETFRERFKITSRGMSRSTWAESSEALADVSNWLIKLYMWTKLNDSDSLARRS